jgi:integrase
MDLAILDDKNETKRRKNANSKRRVPVHSMLLRLGLAEWRNRLQSEGYSRLFPELKLDQTKGYGKAATKWFGSYLARLGWERNGKKVFHSFRSTLFTHCTHTLKMTQLESAQISGHARGSGVFINHYVKDQLPDELVSAVERVTFDLPLIAPFDCDEGLKAISSALKRKARGKGASEDC